MKIIIITALISSALTVLVPRIWIWYTDRKFKALIHHHGMREIGLKAAKLNSDGTYHI